MPQSAVDALSGAITLACYALTLACLAALLSWHGRVRVRVRKGRRQARWFVRSVSVLGFSLAISTPAAAVGSRRPDPPHRRAAAAAPPWSATGGSPPRPPVGSRAQGPPVGTTAQKLSVQSKAHPAIHGRRLARTEAIPLFPRERVSRDRPASNGARASDSRSLDECRARRACMAAHPSSRPRIHVVRPGDSLWTIAVAVLGTEDPVPVARYWARIHRANREVIGPNPDLIHPGQRLALPNSKDIAQDR